MLPTTGFEEDDSMKGVRGRPREAITLELEKDAAELEDLDLLLLMIVVTVLLLLFLSFWVTFLNL